MPEPMVEPMSTATALQRPSWRTSVGEWAGVAEDEVAIRQWYGVDAGEGEGVACARERQVRDLPVDPRSAG